MCYWSSVYHCTALSILWFPSARLELGPILKRDFLYGWSLPYKLSKVWPISAQRKFSVQSLYWARSRNIYVLYWRTFITQIAVLIKSWTKDLFWQILERSCWQAENFQLLLRGRVECCLFTPWESNLFVTHNQYPAKNHHLGQNHRFTPAQKGII